MDDLELIDFSKEDDCLLPLSFRDSVEDVKLSCAVGFDNTSMISRGKMRPVEEKRLSELRKSLDWNSAFFTSQGLLNPEELSMITSRSCQPSFSSLEDVKPDILKPSKVATNRHGLVPNQVVMERRTRKAGAGSTLSNRSQGDLSSKLTSITTLKTKMSKVHRSNESPSSASSKCISRNIKSRNIKPTIVDHSSVLSPLSSPCSSSTSTSRSFHNATSPSDFQTPCCDEARPPIRKTKCLGLRRPYPNTRPFDEAQAVSKGSMHKLNQIEASTLCISAESCLKDKKLLSREHDGRKVGTRCSKPKSNGHIHNDMLKDRMNNEPKSVKNDSSSFKCKVVIDTQKTQEDSDQYSLQESQKEDMCSYEDKVNGLNSHLESIGLDRYAEVKSQGSCAKRGQPFPETSRPSLLRRSRSLDWDKAFISGAGLLNNEEMTVINKGFVEANSNQPSYVTQNDGRPHQDSGLNQTLSDSDGLHLETLESDLLKYVTPDIHIKNKAKKGLKDVIASDHSKAMIDKEKRQDGCKSQEESRRLTFLRKSLDWDSAFIPSAGLLNFEELSLVNQGFKTTDPIQSISRVSKPILPNIHSHQDQTYLKSGDLPLGALEAELSKDVKHDIHKLNKKSTVCKTTYFTSSTVENNPKVHHSVEYPSSGLSKRTRSKTKYRNKKANTIYSGTSPASHFHFAISESNFQSSSRPPFHNFGETKFTKQCFTKFSIGSIMPSGLRMPSLKIGFFDEEQPLNIKESMKIFLEFQSLKRRLSFLNKRMAWFPLHWCSRCIYFLVRMKNLCESCKDGKYVDVFTYAGLLNPAGTVYAKYLVSIQTKLNEN